MTNSDKQAFIAAARDAISDMVKSCRTLGMLNENAAAQGGLAALFPAEAFTGENEGISEATFINFFTNNLPGIESGLFTGNAGANKTNTYSLAKVSRVQ